MFIDKSIPLGVQLLYKAAEGPPSYWFAASHTTDKEFLADPILNRPSNEFASSSVPLITTIVPCN
jgi:hypothetical protein